MNSHFLPFHLLMGICTTAGSLLCHTHSFQEKRFFISSRLDTAGVSSGSDVVLV